MAVSTCLTWQVRIRREPTKYMLKDFLTEILVVYAGLFSLFITPEVCSGP